MPNSRSEFLSYKGRKTKQRQQKNIVLIVCVGVTEKNYFDQFRLDLGEVQVKTIHEARCPTQLVEKAIVELRTGHYSQVWCVFDKDHFEDFDQAILLADRNRVKVAFSNQAFEIWPILHFERITGSLHRDHYASRLTRLLGRPYQKTDHTLYRTLSARMEAAIQNAKWGHEVHLRDRGGMPSNWESCTTVYKLVYELRRWMIKRG